MADQGNKELAKSPIVTACDNLHEHVNRANDLCQKLVLRLESVLTPPCPATSKGVEGIEEDGVPLSDRLFSISDEAEKTCLCLENVLTRLGV